VVRRVVGLRLFKLLLQGKKKNMSKKGRMARGAL